MRDMSALDLPIEILVWSFSIFFSVVLIGLTVGFVWVLISSAWDLYKEKKENEQRGEG